MQMDFSMLNMLPPSPDGRQEEKAPYCPNYFDWRETYPELDILYKNKNIILEEMNGIPTWVPWPEDHFSTPNDYNSKDWTVFPLVYTFPAYDEKSKTWVPSTCAKCPRTVNLLKQIPNLRTALFSKLGPGTKLSNHTGWADLANYVLRTHLCLTLPTDGYCGLIVDGEVAYHQRGEIIVFDDSKSHRAFNCSETQSRIVLIVDLLRPKHIPLGTATGDHTPELDNFVSLFK